MRNRLGRLLCGIGIASLMVLGCAGNAAAFSLLWTKTFDGTDHGDDYGSSVAVGPDGSVCIVGGTEGFLQTKIVVQEHQPLRCPPLEQDVRWPREHPISPRIWYCSGT